jgi:3'-phosphoadenosine 5'-phosphosulfate sulfotransferase (PAPS reductase)/FAD synthetase
MLTLIPTPTAAAWKGMTLTEQLDLVAENARRCRANIRDLADRGAMFVVSHSGGKDSQMLALFIEATVPAAQIVYVHATLGRFEWAGVIEHIEATIAATDELHIAQAIDKVGRDKSFGDMVLSRGMFPSPQQRQCTSDLKRGPIAKVIRRLSRERGDLLIVECTGIRADESVARRRSTVQSFSFDKANSKAGREWYKAAPLADWTTAEVFAEIARRGQSTHWAYEAGMTRLSCSFCIMGSKADQRLAAELRPELYAEIVALEQHVGHTMSMTQQTLEATTGVAASPVAVRRHLNVLRGAA